MIIIEVSEEQRNAALALAKAHPDHIDEGKARGTGGDGAELMLIVQLAALALPVVQAALIEFIRNHQGVSVTIKGLKITARSAADVERIIKSLNDAGMKP